MNKYKIYYIYEIKNLINNKTYRGKRECWVNTFIDVYSDDYMGSGKYLKHAINKYGINNFSKRILTFAEDSDELNILEIQYILCGKNIGKCEYNIAKGGNGGNIFEYMSDEDKAIIGKKISIHNKGRKGWNKGKHHSYETRLKMIESAKRKPPMSKETIDKIAKANRGRIASKETRERMSIRKKGKPLKHTDEWNKRIGLANVGRIVSQNTKDKISQRNKGKGCKKVICVELNKTFNSIRDASKEFNIKETHISRVCRGVRKSTGGFHWKFI